LEDHPAIKTDRIPKEPTAAIYNTPTFRSAPIHVFVNGTTGEGASMTIKERMDCAEAWQDQKNENFRVIIHVGHNSLSESREMTKHARDIRADAVGLIAPNYYKTESLSSLVEINSHVAEAAPYLPYYYYHMPAMSGAFFPMGKFLEMAENRIPNLAGIKYTHEDLMEMKLCLEYGDRKYDILHGRDEILICGLALGVTGAIGSTYNYIAPLYVRLMQAFSQSKLAHFHGHQAGSTHKVHCVK
jgi:N-acetylneuraminate lyase